MDVPTFRQPAPPPAKNPSRRGRLLAALAKTGAMTVVTATAGSAATGRPSDSPWFVALRKPRFQPPPVVFPIVWTTLYADIAATSAVVLDRLEVAGARREATAYTRALALNLAINASWSWVFFRAHRLAAAPVVAGALAVSSSDLSRRAAQADRAAGAALVPYAAWCTFATVLSGAIWWKNRR